jgi:hypothetical protein
MGPRKIPEEIAIQMVEEAVEKEEDVKVEEEPAEKL